MTPSGISHRGGKLVTDRRRALLLLTALSRAGKVYAVEPGKPSKTAIWVASIRALGARDPNPATRCPDFLAEKLLTTEDVESVDMLGIWRMSWPQIMKLGEARATYPMLNQTLRTMHFDATVQQAIREGARQVVILGAGLDTRAYRLKGIEAAKVFEVDYPPTQEYKRRRVMAAIGNIPKNLTYVGIDFTKQTLDDVLPTAGYRADAQTIFLLEGVTYYISEPSLRSTLRFVSKNTAAGSGILFDYQDRRLLDGAGLDDYQDMSKTVASYGEPFILGLVPPKMTQFLSQSDLTFQSDYSTGELCVKYTPLMNPSMMIDSYRWGFHYCLANVKA